MPEPQLTSWEREQVREMIADRRYGARRQDEARREWKRAYIVTAVVLAVSQWLVIVGGVVALLIRMGG